MTTATIPEATARVFKSGNSQAIRLPKEFRVDSPVLEISRRGEEIILRVPKPQKEKNLARAFEILCSLPDDFLPERSVDMPEIREEL